MGMSKGDIHNVSTLNQATLTVQYKYSFPINASPSLAAVTV